MPAYQLAVGIVLCCCALFSAFVFISEGHYKEGELRLPIHDDDDELDGAAKAGDPFDITEPEDLINGYPIREEEFWAKMRVRKFVLACIAAVLAIMQTIMLGWTVAADDSLKEITSAAVHTAFALYILVLSVFYMGHSDFFWHGRFTVHLATLTTTAVILIVAITLLPSELVWEVPQRIAWYISLSLWVAAFWISSRTKRGPALHFPSERIYSEKTLSVATTFPENNVCGITDASPWGVVMFSYTTAVVMLGYTAKSLEIADLPIVPGSMRAMSLYTRMKAAT
ncbi:hypothetical protein EW145_g5549, partial [Phellinidium pouzarii]